jgi:hypothetical protein
MQRRKTVPEIYLGSCLCSRVSYELLTAPKAVTHCHCGQCRKSHGAAFATYGAVPRRDMRILSGDGDVKSYASSEFVLRQFCGHCGSSLFWSRTQGDWSDWICVALGTLDSAFASSKQKHVHLEAKASWFDFSVPCV